MFSVMLITGVGLVSAEAPAEVDASKLAKFDEFHLPRVKKKECDHKVMEKRKELNLPGSGPNRVSDLSVWKPEFYKVNGPVYSLYGECRRFTKDNFEKMGGTFSPSLKSGCTFVEPERPGITEKNAPSLTCWASWGNVVAVLKIIIFYRIAAFFVRLWDGEPERTKVRTKPVGNLNEIAKKIWPERRKPRKPRDDDDDPSISDDEVDSKKHGGGGGDDVINDQEDPSFWDRITDSSSSIFIPFWLIAGLLVLGLIGGCVACIMCATKDSEDEYDLEYGPRARSRSRRSRSGRPRTPSGYSRSRKPSPGFTPGRSRRASGRSRTPGRTPSGMSRMTRSRAPSGHSLSRWKSSRIRRSSRI